MPSPIVPPDRGRPKASEFLQAVVSDHTLKPEASPRRSLRPIHARGPAASYKHVLNRGGPILPESFWKPLTP
jgi:hypothetical protein